MNTKSQTWSMDLMIGIAIFLGLAVVFIFLLFTQTDEFRLREQADSIYSQFDIRTNPDGFGIFDGGSVSREALKGLYVDSQYQDVKNELGIEGDFCIVVVDQTGGIMNISNNYGFGEGEKLEIAEGLYCGS